MVIVLTADVNTYLISYDLGVSENLGRLREAN